MNGTSQNASTKKSGFRDIRFIAGGSVSWTLLFTILVIALTGILCLYSVTISSGSSLVTKQAVVLVMGIVGMIVIANIDYSFLPYIRADVLLWLAGMGAMSACILLNFGADIKRSLNLGFISIEPSEILKFASILFIAFYSDKHKADLQKTGLRPEGTTGFRGPFRNFGNRCLRLGHKLNTKKLFMIFPSVCDDRDFFFDDSFWYHFVLAAGAILPLMLIFLSSHMSAMIIYLVVAVFLLLNCGAKPKYLTVGFIVAVFGAVIFLLFLMSGYQRERISDFAKGMGLPEAGTQSMNALYAICSGGFSGKGFLNSTEKFGYLAESQNDFIFSIFCEEFGLVGALILIAGFALLVTLIYKTGKNAEENYASLSVKGVALMMATQAMLHIAVNTAILPNTGITLPFFSSGGSALLIHFGEIGYVLSVSRGTKHSYSGTVYGRRHRVLQRSAK